MSDSRLLAVTFGVLLLGGWGLPASEKPVKAAPADFDAQRLAARIDEALEAGYKEAGVEPAPLADDAEFMRRAYLDIAGRIPSVAEARAFLKDSEKDKRRKLIDKLLDSPAYATNFANVWRAAMLPEEAASFQVRGSVPGFEAWLRTRFSENVGLDKMAREVITAPVVDRRGRLDPFGRGDTLRPVAFYIAKEGKPENLAAGTARFFLGTKLECAQCHDHPFAKWTRQQFWEYAAFFAGIEADRRDDFINSMRDNPERREIAISSGSQVVQANFLDGSEPPWKYKVSPRETLADWVTSKKNPYFAKAAANRIWDHLFGIGIVEPVDDLGDDNNKPSHPELLEELATQLADHEFDQKFLIRAIANSKAYQRTSEITTSSPLEPRLFARMPIKGLTGEQLFDSMAQATGYHEDRSQRSPFDFEERSPRTQIVMKFALTDKRTEAQTSILQALALMNGKFVSDATSVQNSVTLAGVIDAPWMKTADKVEALYLSALSRKPRAEELERLVKYVDRGGPDGDKDKALADVFWALLNSSEFILNH